MLHIASFLLRASTFCAILFYDSYLYIYARMNFLMERYENAESHV